MGQVINLDKYMISRRTKLDAEMNKARDGIKTWLRIVGGVSPRDFGRKKDERA